ncbi:unnamed protein product [Diatraea saccharalis]|uniref:Uncharacterized protein n=1 Tax=Diatraea saccharalis TaxID=40085 RepID=A0A9N9QV62_9NEOP|nr:unnamed protein product [Diatraea saccharalis]
MALSDSMFLFEIIIEELKSLFDTKDYSIYSQFADIFQLYLKNPNELGTSTPKQTKKKFSKKSKVRVRKSIATKSSTESKVRLVRSVLISNSSEILKDNMRKYPLEISFRSKYKPEIILASNQIPWSDEFIYYLNELDTKDNMHSITVDGKYNVFHEYTSKCIATIKLNIKLCCVKGTQLNFLSNTAPAIKEEPKRDLRDETGIIKTIYAGGKTKLKRSSGSPLLIKTLETSIAENKMNKEDANYIEYNSNNCSRNKIVSLVKSYTDIRLKKKVSLVKSQSCHFFEYGRQLNTLNYIFGNNRGPFGNQVYCVGYFTVQNEFAEKPVTSKESVKDSKSSEKSAVGTEKYQFKLCDDECPSKKASTFGSPSHCSLDLPKDAAHLISIKKCDQVDCDFAKTREPPSPPDERLMVDLSSMRRDSCVMQEKIEQIVGGMTAKMQMGAEPCYCSCECTFGFTKKTTYCHVCGGVEKFGEEKLGPLAFPCPIYHKLVDKNKLKTVSSGSDSKKKSSKHPDKSGESEKENKKGKKKKKDDRFKFNYGYTVNVLCHVQFRPMWKPGATNKYVVRLLKIAKNPDEAISKKRKREPKKKPLKRPLLVVHKKDGEFTVTMETMKAYAKQRAINQQPYEEKPLVTYTIGRSEEENRERRKKKERAQRRLERDQRDFIQSAFKDMCQEICLKTYQQALGILPNAEDPECTCYPAEPGPDRTNMDRSCSCSEDSVSLGSDTDSDEWIVEFTPPNAYFDPTYKGKKVMKVEKETQYSYLDYRVKLVDKYGNPVPRFFKGPDGKQQCSDLGGFWSPEHEWLEINVDGYIAPDNRWAPMSFIGPNGDQIDTEDGKFQVANGKWLVVGVDGYIDSRGKWRFYSKPRASPVQKKVRPTAKKAVKKGDHKPIMVEPSETTWSCFGDASPVALSKMGIVGHGIDRKLLAATLKRMLDRGEDVTIPQPSVVPRRLGSKKSKKARSPVFDRQNYFEERTKCRHPVPSKKGVIAVNAHGDKIYFKLKDHKNKRPYERLAKLNEQGISLSDFHVANGWKPGAISKCLLRKLKKAKLRRHAVESSKPTKKAKKRTEAKPTLIVCKVNGEYRIEMQTSPENNEGNNEQYSPLVYKIAKPSNKDKLAKLQLKKRCLVKEIIGDFEDPYHPEICEKTCLKAYKQAIGLLPNDHNNPECSCGDCVQEESSESCHCEYDDVSSDCSSMDIDWEIHFSPPITSHS